MGPEAGEKVTREHLSRKAYLYVRQSTVRQVLENTESTERQYALKKRARALGWTSEQIVVIDSDLGRSAASGAEREGFQRLVAEVSMGRAGIVLGLEVSRLARSCSDWHRLLEICALTATLILDEDGLYNPGDFNDRLLLGLKGTMSEAELHVLRARLRGGLLNKARRGELKLRLPAGFVHDERGRVILDPDRQVKQTIRMFFETFKRVGTARAVVKSFREQGLVFPTRIHTGPSKGELVWNKLTVSRAIQVLHNPCYAGTYVYGRTQTRTGGDGRVIFQALPRERWHTIIPDAHEGYISWDQYEENQRCLRENWRVDGCRRFPPREGPALLQGIVVCGKCGALMSPRYRTKGGRFYIDYWCKGMGNTQARHSCQNIPGLSIDRAISDLLLEVVTPVALETALAVDEEIRSRFEETDRLRRRQVERVRYEAELARRRYMQVDPENRLVAGSLEEEWNEKLQALASAEEEYERRRQSEGKVLDEEVRKGILALATDFPRLWRNTETPDRERKRMIRLLIDEVTLMKDGCIKIHVRFRGGATRSITLPRPPLCWEKRVTPREVVAQIDRLLEDHTYGEIAAFLDEQGIVSGCGNAFDGRRVMVTANAHNLKNRYARLRDKGLLTLDEVARKLGRSKATIKRNRAKGLLGVRSYKLNDCGEYMYEDPDLAKCEWKSYVSGRMEEVQYEV